MRQIIALAVSLLVTVYLAVIVSSMVKWHKNEQSRFTRKYVYSVCEDYKDNLKKWKKIHGQEWLDSVKKDAPDLWKANERILDKGIDYLLPD